MPQRENRQEQPVNQVHSIVGEPWLMQPGAPEKQPISKTFPWGFVKTWQWLPATSIIRAGVVILALQKRHRNHSPLSPLSTSSSLRSRVVLPVPEAPSALKRINGLSREKPYPVIAGIMEAFAGNILFSSRPRLFLFLNKIAEAIPGKLPTAHRTPQGDFFLVNINHKPVTVTPAINNMDPVSLLKNILFENFDWCGHGVTLGQISWLMILESL